VVASIYLLLNVGLRRALGIKGNLGGAGAGVSVIARIPLDQKRWLFVVRVAQEYLLIGGGEGSLTLLSKLDKSAVEELALHKAAEPTAMTPFLQRLLSRRGSSKPPSA
jgi:flagellar biogenesis protein FliO